MKKAAYLGCIANPQRPYGQEYATMKSQITTDPLSFPFPAPGSVSGSPANAPGSLLFAAVSLAAAVPGVACRRHSIQGRFYDGIALRAGGAL